MLITFFFFSFTRRKRAVQTVLSRGPVYRVLYAEGQRGGRDTVRTGQVRHMRARRVPESRLRPCAELGQTAGPVRRVRRQQLQLQTGVRPVQQLAAGILEGAARAGRLLQPGHPAARVQRFQQGRQLSGAGGQRHRRVHTQRQLRAEHVQQGHRVRRHRNRVQRVGRAGRTDQLVQAAEQRSDRRGNTAIIIDNNHCNPT